jgi:asparagine synthase (glutamine-hydrolysing)
MCGICGIFDLNGNPINGTVLDRMTDVIRHRGPDGDGRFVDREIGLGHRRLSIIDLGGGAQPIGNEDGKLQIVFNGEIYNFVELRVELEAAGHRFKTKSDTEVIVHAYEQWGADCVKRFNGMFAFALWDGSKRELFMARDHLGIKPLYHVTIGSKLVFGSEIKSLLLHPGCPREVDTESLAELFTFRYVPSPKTLFKGISKLPPGYSMLCRRGDVKISRFWNWIPKIRESVREPELIEEYQSLLQDAVKLQMRSDVPVGLFLSSGVDSGVLLALMREHAAGKVQTFTIGFEGGESTNEIEDAAATAKQYGAEHDSMMVTHRDYLDYFARYMNDMEEPVGHEASPAFYFVSKITSHCVKVALTGQGADEPWAGYGRYVGIKYSSLYGKLPGFVTRGVGPMLAKMPGRMERLKRGLISLGEPDVLTRLTKVYSFFSADMKQAMFKGNIAIGSENEAYRTKEAIRHLQEDVKHLDPLSQMLYVDTRANLPDDLLMVGDKTAMANSIEVRVPLLDVRMVEFIESLPPQYKLRGLTGKYLHKKALLKWLPREVVYRKKKGFAHPLAKWFSTSMRPMLEELLLSKDSAMGIYFDQKYIRTILDRHRDGLDDCTRHIYLLLSLELWHRTLISQSPVPKFTQG